MPTNEYKVGTEEQVTVKIEAEIMLVTQPVEITINGGTTWLPASWQGPVGLERRAITDDNITFTGPRKGTVYARVFHNGGWVIIEADDFLVTRL